MGMLREFDDLSAAERKPVGLLTMEETLPKKTEFRETTVGSRFQDLIRDPIFDGDTMRSLYERLPDGTIYEGREVNARSVVDGTQPKQKAEYCCFTPSHHVEILN